MAIIRWTPLRSMMSFRDEMDRLLGDMYGRLEPSADTYEGGWIPAMDVSETDDVIAACVELPGLAKEDIRVSVKSDVLTISGEKKQEKVDDKENIHRVERTYGAFKRVLKLHAEVDSSKVKAAYKDGVLTVTMPKTEAKKPRVIPVARA